MIAREGSIPSLPTNFNMTSLLFSSVYSAISAYSISRNHGLYCVLDGKTLKFESDDDAQIAEAVLPSFGIFPL